jgi:hypothetical protein
MPQPTLRRRSFLKLGIGSAVVLAVAGGTVAMLKPGLVDGKLSPSAREAMGKIGQAMLAGLLPSEPAALQAATEAILQRADVFLAGLPVHVLEELGQLLSLLTSAAGRRLLVGLPESWAEATVAQTSTALQSMRESGMALRIQAYQGLHDIVFAPYFSGEESWQAIGYPGPRAV